MKVYKKRTKAVEAMTYDEVLSYGKNICKSYNDELPLEFNIEDCIFNLLPNGSYSVTKEKDPLMLVLAKDAVILFADNGIDVVNKNVFDKEYISLEDESEQEEIRKPIAKVICGFIGSGKSTYTEEWSQYSEKNLWRKNHYGNPSYNNLGYHTGDKIVDLNIDDFRYKNEKDKKLEHLSSDYPENLISYLKVAMCEENIIFLPCDKIIRDALKEAGIPYYLVFPERDMRWDHIHLTMKDYPSELRDFVNHNWDDLISALESDDYAKQVRLTSDGINCERITSDLMIGNIIECYVDEV